MWSCSDLRPTDLRPLIFTTEVPSDSFLIHFVINLEPFALLHTVNSQKDRKRSLTHCIIIIIIWRVENVRMCVIWRVENVRICVIYAHYLVTLNSCGGRLA